MFAPAGVKECDSSMRVAIQRLRVPAGPPSQPAIVHGARPDGDRRHDDARRVGNRFPMATLGHGQQRRRRGRAALRQHRRFRSAVARPALHRPRRPPRRRRPRPGWQAPAVNPATGRPFACDPNYGPKAEVLGMSEIEGEYRGVGRWKVTVSGSPAGATSCSSNRWTVRAVTNTAGLTTRFIDGWAQCGPTWSTPKTSTTLTTSAAGSSCLARAAT